MNRQLAGVRFGVWEKDCGQEVCREALVHSAGLGW
jgi:hypothetical protein